jgi:hypothetical protein
MSRIETYGAMQGLPEEDQASFRIGFKIGCLTTAIVGVPMKIHTNS